MDTFLTRDKDAWDWTMMIMQPTVVTADLIAAARSAVRARKSLPAIEALRFETFTEGLCAQTLHVGPFSAEGPTIERVHACIANHGALTGKHHEIYLSDVRRADPRRWKTIIRQPLRMTP